MQRLTDERLAQLAQESRAVFGNLGVRAPVYVGFIPQEKRSSFRDFGFIGLVDSRTERDIHARGYDVCNPAYRIVPNRERVIDAGLSIPDSRLTILFDSERKLIDSFIFSAPEGLYKYFKELDLPVQPESINEFNMRLPINYRDLFED
jgi:hypothetical protein